MVVKSRQQYCWPDNTRIAAMGFRDASGNIIKQAAAGSQMSVQIIINNNDCDVPDHPATILLEVRDSEGLTKYFAFQQIAREPNQ